MPSESKLPKVHIDYFIKLLGSNLVKTDLSSLEAYGKDWTRGFEPLASCILFPTSTGEVSEILKYCNEHKLAVVPSGGRTGLAAAAFACNGEVVISLEKMNKILEIDETGLTMVVEAGVTTQAVQEAAKEKNLFFALNLASKGSSQIGGNIATNAGGTKLIRYGGMREQLLGVEVVLADGRIFDMNTSLRKNNTGYDLKQLFVGSEGTLGIITKATLRLIPPPRELSLACFAVSGFEALPKLLALSHKLSLQLTACECFSDFGLDLVLRYHPQLRAPFATRSLFYLIIEQEDFGRAQESFERFCELASEKNLIDDAVIASSSHQFHELWALRENISESISKYGHVRKNDISLPINRLDEFVAEVKVIVEHAPKEIELVLFGHIGDGNLHINYIAPSSLDRSQFLNMATKVEKEIFSILPKYKGSISAEHGIGLSKKKDLCLSRSEEEVALMRAIKKLLDPNQILNPGKIFDLN